MSVIHRGGLLRVDTVIDRSLQLNLVKGSEADKGTTMATLIVPVYEAFEAEREVYGKAGR